MPAHRSYLLPGFRALMAERSRGNQHGAAQCRKLAAARVIVWSDVMRETLIAEYLRGRSVEAMAAHIGVARSVARAELARLGLPRGRWVTAARRAAAVRDMRAARDAAQGAPQAPAGGIMGWGRLYPTSWPPGAL